MISKNPYRAKAGRKRIKNLLDDGQRPSMVVFILYKVAGEENNVRRIGAYSGNQIVVSRVPMFARMEIAQVQDSKAIQLSGQARNR